MKKKMQKLHHEKVYLLAVESISFLERFTISQLFVTLWRSWSAANSNQNWPAEWIVLQPSSDPITTIGNMSDREANFAWAWGSEQHGSFAFI